MASSSSSMEAADQEPQIEIPTHFLCPISLQLMLDPVTVSTGITYDRPSIHRWLVSSSASVCPVTKQPLSSAAGLTPNHVLRRLTRFLTESHYHDPESQRNSIKLLRSLYSVAGPNQLTAVDPELFAQTVRLLGRNGPTATTKWALKLLSRLAPWGRNRVKAVNAGAVEPLCAHQFASFFSVLDLI